MVSDGATTALTDNHNHKGVASDEDEEDEVLYVRGHAGALRFEGEQVAAWATPYRSGETTW